jgi:hypothetical protein
MFALSAWLPGPGFGLVVQLGHHKLRVSIGPHFLQALLAVAVRSAIMLGAAKAIFWLMLGEVQVMPFALCVLPQAQRLTQALVAALRAEAERESTKQTSLRDALLERDMRFTNPLHFVDQADVYVSALQVSSVQLSLVEEVLAHDYAAAVKVCGVSHHDGKWLTTAQMRQDYNASTITTKPDDEELQLVREELQAFTARLREVGW